jgi:hypothetical protein
VGVLVHRCEETKLLPRLKISALQHPSRSRVPTTSLILRRGGPTSVDCSITRKRAYGHGDPHAKSNKLHRSFRSKCFSRNLRMLIADNRMSIVDFAKDRRSRWRRQRRFFGRHEVSRARLSWNSHRIPCRKDSDRRRFLEQSRQGARSHGRAAVASTP